MDSIRIKEPITTSSYKKISCLTCNDSGFEIIHVDASSLYGENFPPVEYALPCRACSGGLRERADFVRSVSFIPECFLLSRYKDFDWGAYGVDVSRQKRYVNSFLSDFESWENKSLGLYVSSVTRGSGKTFLSCCLANELIDAYAYAVKFVSFARLIEISQNPTQTMNIDLLCSVRILIIDDLCSKKSGESWSSDILFSIVDTRLSRGLVTIITANVPLVELRLDDRLVDRLNAMCQQIQLPEVCIRSKIANSEKKKLYTQLGLLEAKT